MKSTWIISLGLGLAISMPAVLGNGSAGGYLGTAVPIEIRRFSDDSPWNRPIPADASVDPNSDNMIRNLIDTLEKKLRQRPVLKPAIDGWAPPIHVVDSRYCPKAAVSSSLGQPYHDSVDPDGDGVVQDIPIPDEVWPAQFADGHLIILDAHTRVCWEFSKFKVAGRRVYQSTTLTKWNLDGCGYGSPFAGRYWWRFGCNGAGTAYLAGVVTLEEFKRGGIRHALSILTPINRKKISAGVPYEVELCAPVAARSDAPMANVGPQYIPEGARIQLNPHLDLDRLGLSEPAKIVAKALQTYGGFIMDNAPAFKFACQNVDKDGSGRTWMELYPDMNLHRLPLSEFRVLRIDDLVTK